MFKTSILCLLFLLFGKIYHLTAQEDPLENFKKYYREHPEYKVNKIPTVEDIDGEYDFIIVGGGSAGSVLANRLSEHKDWKILLLEAGEQADFISDVPLFSYSAANTKYDWNYSGKNQTRCCLNQGGKCQIIRGKALGGSSMLNMMLYMRGNKLDYEHWRKLGNVGWSYKEVLPYFKKSENIQIHELRNSSYHGKKDPLAVSADVYETPATDMMINAGIELGYNVIDYNGANRTGFARMQLTTKGGKRFSAAEAFIRPAATRKNLSILTSARVTQVIINYVTNTAVGVRFVKDGRLRRVFCTKEVILSASTFNSPALLMLSGIGPKKILDDLEIRVIQELSVGENLIDHVGASLNFDLTMDGVIHDDAITNIDNIQNYFEHGQGPLTTPGLAAYGFVKTKFIPDKDDYPDIELIINGNNINVYAIRDKDRYYGSKKITKSKNRRARSQEKTKVSMLVMLFNPKNTGTVKIVSKDPKVQPEIDVNCFADRKDVEALKDGLKLVSSIQISGIFSLFVDTYPLLTIFKSIYIFDFERIFLSMFN